MLLKERKPVLDSQELKPHEEHGRIFQCFDICVTSDASNLCAAKLHIHLHGCTSTMHPFDLLSSDFQIQVAVSRR